jgi:hypothetical protein
MSKHKHQRENATYNYIRGYNELYDNIPPAETFINGMSLIHIVKRKATGEFYDNYWINLIVDEINKPRFTDFLKDINRAYKEEIEDIVHNDKSPKVLINFYFEKLKATKMRFFIGNPFNYLHYE